MKKMSGGRNDGYCGENNSIYDIGKIVKPFLMMNMMSSLFNGMHNSQITKQIN